MSITIRAALAVSLLVAQFACNRKPVAPTSASEQTSESGSAAALARELEQARKDVATWKARAKAFEAKLAATNEELAEAKKPPAKLPNASLPVGDRVIRVWDINARMVRDVRVRDFDWSNVHQAGMIFGQSKSRKDVLVEIRDQVAEAWVIEFVTGKKVDIPTP